MSQTFRAAMRSLANVPDARMTEPWTWQLHPDAPGEVRDALYVALEAEQVAAATSPPPDSEPARILTLAERAFGDLVGLLIGLDDSWLEREPGHDEWPLREVLKHIWSVEKSYARAVSYALTRRADQPVREENRPAFEAAELPTFDAWFEALAEARRESRGFVQLSEAELQRPAIWSGLPIDVRFRLHRFASHLSEHTVQCEKVLAALGQQPTEAGRVARRICALRGAHEHHSPPAVLAQLDNEHAKRLSYS